MTIAGFRLSEVLPGRAVYLPHRDGLTAIYGRNGVGKSRLLAALSDVLSPDERLEVLADPRTWLHDAGPVHCTFGGGMLTDVLQPTFEDVTGEELTDKDVEEAFELMAEDLRSVLSDGTWLGPSPAGLSAAGWSDLVERLTHRGRAVALTVGSEQLNAVGLLPQDLPDEVVAAFDAWSASPGIVSQLWSEHRDGRLPSWAAMPLVAVVRPDPELPLLILLQSVRTSGASMVAVGGSPRDTVAGLVGLCERAVAGYDGEDPVPGAHPSRQEYRASAVASLRDPVALLEGIANRELARFLGDKSPRLRILASGGARRWMALDGEDGPTYPVDQLSRAQAKWAAVGIEAASNTARQLLNAAQVRIDGQRSLFALPRSSYHPGASILLVDEPEEALHPTGVHHVAHALGEATREATYAATHSPVIIAAADQTIHLVRDDERLELRAEPGDGLLQPVLELSNGADHGLLPSDFLALSRLLILTEGSHDALVIRTLLGRQLAQARGLLARALGTSNMPSLIRDLLAFRALTCPVLVLVDDFHDEDRAWWAALASRGRRGEDVDTLIAEVRTRASHRGDRWDVFRQIADVAVQRDAFDRLHLDGFPTLDIPMLLPPETLGLPGTVGWDVVSSAVHEAEGKLTSAGIKRWMATNGTPIDRRTVARACLAVQRGDSLLDERAEHALDQVGQTILRLGATPRRLLDDL